jgi:protein-S-isoprenylcysteine O-methyltransferase Ste14
MGELLFKIRGYTPIPFFLISVIDQQLQPGLINLGLLLVLWGELLRLWGVSYAGAATRTRHVGAPELVTNGPYAYLRNPLYLGNIFMYSGVVIAFGGCLPHLLYLVIFFFSLQYILIIKVEENKLRELFGEKYKHYQESVPRFLPRLSPYPRRTKVKSHLAGALRSEKSTFVVIAALVLIFLIRAYLFK